VLISRLQDPSAIVLEALYSKPSAITPIMLSDSTTYISSLCASVSSQAKHKRAILRLHLSHLASHLWTIADPSIRDDIFHRILFPFLLFTKPRQKTAELVWDIIGEHLSETSSSNTLTWLLDCATLVKTQTIASDGTESVDLMNQVNFDVSAKIAGA